MESATPSKKMGKPAAALADQLLTPEKPARKVAAAAATVAEQIWTPEKPTRKVAAAAVAEQIWTPEKPEQPSAAARRARSSGGVAFSVKGVRRAALELRRRSESGAASPAAEEDELEAVERQLGVGPAPVRSPVKRKAKLPESYEMLCEFFNCFESSTRLLRMKGSKASFPNICASIQHLSERRFTYSHLAQLKYIMPEAIVINKILLRDETTCCMKPDLQVNLLADAVEGVAKQKGETGYSALRRIFRQRLVDFFRDHPEGDDIPEHELPHPFGQTRSSAPQTVQEDVPKPVCALPSSSATDRQPVAMSHMPHSFKRMFSQRSAAAATATTSTTSPLSKVEPSILSPLSRKSLLGSPVSGSLSLVGESDCQGKSVQDVAFKFGVSEGTPAKFASTPVRLMAETPILQTPKRPVVTGTGYDTPPLKMAKRSARTKLFMTPTKDASSMEEQRQSTSASTLDGDDELLSFLPKSLLQSVKDKENRALEEKQTGFADRIKREKLIASLPSIFDIIFLIYQSRQRSVMTKQELIHKIIASNPKIVDRGEVEDELKLLEEIVPDWISEKTARTGDVLCCVDTAMSQAEIRQRLYAAE
uniref:CDT1 Geminin-binding domain-containing protein n=1 Tax=Oryza punctata TaxID=4537 RepID=A0A0E0KMY3_ORYPU